MIKYSTLIDSLSSNPFLSNHFYTNKIRIFLVLSFLGKQLFLLIFYTFYTYSSLFSYLFFIIVVKNIIGPPNAKYCTKTISNKSITILDFSLLLPIQSLFFQLYDSKVYAHVPLCFIFDIGIFHLFMAFLYCSLK